MKSLKILLVVLIISSCSEDDNASVNNNSNAFNYPIEYMRSGLDTSNGMITYSENGAIVPTPQIFYEQVANSITRNGIPMKLILNSTNTARFIFSSASSSNNSNCDVDCLNTSHSNMSITSYGDTLTFKVKIDSTMNNLPQNLVFSDTVYYGLNNSTNEIKLVVNTFRHVKNESGNQKSIVVSNNYNFAKYDNIINNLDSGEYFTIMNYGLIYTK